MRCPEDRMPEVRTKKSFNSLPCQSDLEGRAGQRREVSSDYKSSSCFKWAGVRRVPCSALGPASTGPGGAPASHLQQWTLEQGEQAAQTSSDMVFFF